MDSHLYISFLDAIEDTAVIVPFLLLIFFIIEIVEHFYSDKILSCAKFSKKTNRTIPFAPFLGAILAAIPQCGLSVIASTLYCKRMITRGTLIAIYLATSDEALPVLISNPEGHKIILPLIIIKILTGFAAGFLIDIILPSKNKFETIGENIDIKIEKGCHSHSIGKKIILKELILHPLVHTLSVSFFVFLITFLINLIFAYFDFNQLIIFHNSLIEPVFTAIFGLIPNCAVSVGIAIMYLKGAISFASCVSGLCAGAGLGILVLIKNNNDKKDTLSVILLLLLISILAGFITEFMGSYI